MSAKTGDSVSSCFYRVAADLAGVVLTKPEMEVAAKVVRAEIVNHPQDDQSKDGLVAPAQAERPPARKGKGGACLVQ